MRGYKAMNEDMTCRDFQFELGKTYEEDHASICQSGFHFCAEIAHTFNYYSKMNCRVFEIEADGAIERNGVKFCCSRITIKREITGAELNRVRYGYGYGDGDGDGYGYGYGYGYGDGDGDGYGYGYGDGYGYGYGDGYGYGYGDGDGYGDGYGYGNNIQKILTFKE